MASVKRARRQQESGFVLILVLWITIVLSSLALFLSTEVRTEARAAASDREALAAEQLALSGQEIAEFLLARGLGSTGENFAGLPIQVRTPGFHYSINLPDGDIELYLESENGKINLATADRPFLENFFALWSGNAAFGTQIAAAVMDWRDGDDDAGAGTSERLSYVPMGYAPRNAGVNIADSVLIHGLSRNDYLPSIARTPAGSALREGLAAFVTAAPVGNAVNPNFAPELVIRAIPGLNPAEVNALLEARKRKFILTAEELRLETGIPLTSNAWPYLAFGRGGAPAILAVAHFGTVRRSVRRVYHQLSVIDPLSGLFAPRLGLMFVERDVYPHFVE